jgi:hypothetical protein
MAEVPPSQCPRCFVRLDRANEVTSTTRGPEPGDITVCLHCGGIAMFDDDMRLIQAPEEKVTIEAAALSLLYYRPVITVFVEDNGKIH